VAYGDGTTLALLALLAEIGVISCTHDSWHSNLALNLANPIDLSNDQLLKKKLCI
jgi:hypothetical protein